MASETLSFDILIGRDQAAGAFGKTAEAAGRASGNVRQLGRDLTEVGKKRAVPVLAVDDKDAKAKLDAVRTRLAELGAKVTQARVGVRDKEAQAALAAWAVKLDALGRKTADPRIKVDGVDRAEAQLLAVDVAMDRLGKKTARPGVDLSGLKAPGPGGAALLLSPSLIPLAAGIAGAVSGIGVSLGGAGIAAGAFGALAKTVMSGAGQDAVKLAALQVKLSDATTAKQRASIQQQISNLKKGWSQSYTDLVTVTGKIHAQWGSLAKSVATPVLVPWLDAVSRFLSHMRPLVQPVADVFHTWGTDIDRYFGSKKGSAELGRIAGELGRFGAGQMKAIGTFIFDVGKGAAALGRDLAAHGADFGAFGKHLDSWGAAFARWAQSAGARHDVGALLDWVHANGKTTGDLLHNLGKFLAEFAPGLAAAGQLELRAVSGFLGFVAKLPKGVAKPLLDTAGALLLLSKTGVLKVGLKVVGPAVKWLTGGLINLGGGASAGAEIRAAMVSGGAAAAAEIRAAMTGGGAAGGVSTASAGASGAAAGRAAGGGFLVAFRAAMTPALAGVLGGLLIRAAGDTLSPAGSFAGKLNADFQADGHMWSTTLLHSFTFGGLEGWLTAKIGLPVGNFLNGMAAGAKAWGQNVTGSVTGAWASMAGGAKTWWGNITGTVSGSLGRMGAGARGTAAGMAGDFTHMSGIIAQAMQQSGLAADRLRTRNLMPLRGEAGKVSGGIQGLAGYIGGTLSGAMNTGGQHADAFRTRNLGPLRGELARDDGGVQGLQAAIDRMHGKTVTVTVVGSGKGAIRINSFGVGSVGTTGLKFMARGGAVTGGTPGRDSVLGMLMPGEVVVPAGMVRRGAVDHLRGRLPGFASGGLVGAIDAAPGVAASAEAGFAAKVETAFAQRALAALRAAAGSGSGIVAYARSFLGQIPYVMGGNSLSGGIDCSGFVQQVYGHFGIHAPRTSETQFGWARRTGPVPGGMAFYVSPAGGPPPGHVAIVQDASSVISQGGGMGPKIEPLRFLPLMGTGVPPGGLPAAMGKGGNPAVSGSLQAIALSLLKQYGWGNQWGAFNNLENAEAGWNMTARNPSSGAYGLAQFINGPGEYAQYGGDAVTGLGQLTAMMNYIGQRWHDPDGAWANEAAHHWYAKGGLVQKFDQGGTLRPGVTLAVNNTGHGEQVIPGYASGGLVSARAAAYLRAWEAHHSGTINDQAARAGRALAHDSTLARATLPPGLHHHYVTLAAADRHRRDALLHERGIMRDWRNQLGASDQSLASWIAAAGHSRLLAPDVRRWERQRAGQEREIGRVSVMLGPTPAMRAAAAKVSAAHPPRPSSAQTAKEGAAYLRAWQARRGGGPGAAWGPVPVNPQIDQMNAAAKQAATLAGARGLTAAQRKHYVQLAGADRARVAVLIHERDTERAWRNILGADDRSLASWIAAAAGTPSMTKNAAGWKAQLARQKATIAGISGMLGWSAAQVKAGSGGPPLPKITHTYGGDVANTIGAFLSSVAAPFTGKLMDRGGWLKPGWSSVYNATGRPEHLVPARSGGTIQLEIVSSGQSEFDQFMVTWMRRHVKVRGGGNVQAAFGTH